jgi:predicted transcriptional regulator
MKLEYLGLRLPKDLRDQVEALAQREDRTVSQMARRLIAQQLVEQQVARERKRKARPKPAS